MVLFDSGLMHGIDLYGLAPILTIILNKTVSRDHKRPFDVTNDLKRQHKFTSV